MSNLYILADAAKKLRRGSKELQNLLLFPGTIELAGTLPGRKRHKHLISKEEIKVLAVLFALKDEGLALVDIAPIVGRIRHHLQMAALIEDAQAALDDPAAWVQARVARDMEQEARFLDAQNRAVTALASLHVSYWIEEARRGTETAVRYTFARVKTPDRTHIYDYFEPVPAWAGEDFWSPSGRQHSFPLEPYDPDQRPVLVTVNLNAVLGGL